MTFWFLFRNYSQTLREHRSTFGETLLKAAERVSLFIVTFNCNFFFLQFLQISLEELSAFSKLQFLTELHLRIGLSWHDDNLLENGHEHFLPSFPTIKNLHLNDAQYILFTSQFELFFSIIFPSLEHLRIEGSKHLKLYLDENTNAVRFFPALRNFEYDFSFDDSLLNRVLVNSRHEHSLFTIAINDWCLASPDLSRRIL